MDATHDPNSWRAIDEARSQYPIVDGAVIHADVGRQATL